MCGIKLRDLFVIEFGSFDKNAPSEHNPIVLISLDYCKVMACICNKNGC